jgi:hypothetical protein
VRIAPISPNFKGAQVIENQSKAQVGDTLTPALQPHATGLHETGELAARLRATAAPRSSPTLPIVDVANTLRAQQPASLEYPTCEQKLWFTFFFDGTGNNMDADVGTLKHSNVAKLYRVHRAEDKRKGIYRVYVPGVGTYFQPVGDPGGLDLGLGAGRFGEARIAWALGKFTEFMRPHLQRAANPSNKILEVNLALFGFSRGAALARAFVNLFLEKMCTQAQGTSAPRLIAGGCPLRVRFMGLFDTVASVGSPMSLNNTSVVGAAASSISYTINYRLNHFDLADVKPVRLAFAPEARPGADPAGGRFAGHDSWGKRMHVPHFVEEVRHFVAAHEIRNSFPLDSVSVLESGKINRPEHFYETVYPGAHSDVGGSYRPGEGGRSGRASEKLGLIPLMHMFNYAISSGVPLLSSQGWDAAQKVDFAVEDDVHEYYNYYLTKLGPGSSLGALITANMKLYFAWRFRSIRSKAHGNRAEWRLIERTRASYQTEIRQQEGQVEKFLKANDVAVKKCQDVRRAREMLMNRGYIDPARSAKMDQELADAEALQARTQDQYLREKASLSGILCAGPFIEA